MLDNRTEHGTGDKGTTKCRRNALKSESPSPPAQGSMRLDHFRTPRSAPISPGRGSSESQSHASLTARVAREGKTTLMRVNAAQAWGSPMKERAPRKLGGGERNE